jgi:PAS domain S-box-containing protein
VLRRRRHDFTEHSGYLRELTVADRVSGQAEAISQTGLSAREGQDRFRLLIESVIDYGIFMLDTQGRVASWNAGAERLKGYSAADIIGKHFSTFYRPDEAASGKCERELEIAAHEGRFEEEGWRVRKDSSLFWANVVITAIRGETGELLGYAKVTRDLTERKSAEEELKRSEERLRLLITSVKDYAIFVLDPGGHVATWNTGAERLKGYTAEQIIGQHFSRFYPEADVKAGKCELELDVAARDGRFEDEGWRIRRDGTRFWANVVISPIVDAGGILLGFAKVTRDLSERKRHEEERLSLARAEEGRRIAEEHQTRTQALAESLRRARDRAEESTRLKDEFLATVSHELRTPLNAILGWSRMLRAGSLDADKVSRAIDSILRNAISQNQIIDDLLDVSRIIAGQLRLDVDVLEINQIVAAAVDVVRPAAEAKGVELQVLLDPEAGAIRGDAGRLQQVLWNLLNNAVKFTPRAGTVTVTLRRESSAIRIEVSDTGKGIAPEFMARLFDRFTQEDAGISRTTGGLGLGLAIVKHLVELHGGTVAAHSAGESKGSTFIVTIPIAAVNTTRVVPQPASAEQETVSFPAELAGLHVLVVDDELDARELVQIVLEQGGATVGLASSVAQALDAIASRKPDVIVSDIGMPDEDGYAFIRKLRALPREQGGRIPAIALTAYARAEDRRRALGAGFQNHAAKPIEPQELVLVIANLVGRYG